jgi:hypothetical protein|nr:hypothetical protein [Neorhizobium tomejilense]
MDIEEFRAVRERNRPLDAEKASQRRKAIDEYDDAMGDMFDTVGVRQTLGGGRFGQKRTSA